MSSKENKRNLAWGLLLITFGLAALSDTYFDANDWINIGILALGGLACLGVFLTDRTDWMPLIPAYILLAATGIGSLALGGYAEGEFFASFVLVLVGLPFLLVYLNNRNQWWALIPMYVLFIIAVIIFVEELGLLQGEWIATAILSAIAIPFLIIFLINREFWWALIPFYVLMIIAVMLPLIEANLLVDSWIATYVMSAIGLPFVLVYLLNRQNWWALIPAFVLLSIGLMVGLIDARILTDLMIPGYVMWSIALPFFVVYLVNRKQRWALIPGGITGFIGLAFFISTDFFKYVAPAALILFGGWVLLRAVKTN